MIAVIVVIIATIRKRKNKNVLNNFSINFKQFKLKC